MKRPILIYITALAGILLTFVSNTKAQTAAEPDRESASLSQALIDFTGKSQNNTIVLSWKTLTRTDNVSFNVQRSKDGTEWEDIGKISGNANALNSFSFSDNNPKEAVNYYRLKIEREGKSDYSSLITVKYVIETNKTMLYPNPTKNVIWIKAEEANNNNKEIIDLEVYDILGERIYASKMETGNTQKVDMSNYQTGYYCVKIGNQTYKVFKE